MLDIYLTMEEIKKIPLDKILKTLGDPIRLSAVKQLLEKTNQEITCGEFNYKVQKATFSHHIKILIESQILSERVEGVRKYLSINPQIKIAYPELLKVIKSS